MKNQIGTAFLLFALALNPVVAASVDFLIVGQITNSRDDLGWFSGAFPQNSIFTGRITYDTSLAYGSSSNPSNPTSHLQYKFDPNPIDPPAMSVTDVNGHVFSSANEFFVNTYDNYGLNPPLPGLDPFDEIYYATYSNFRFDGSSLTTPHQFADFGIFFKSSLLTSTTSDALPTSAPDLAAFADSYIDIYLFGYGENPPIVWCRGTITSVTPVPEPTLAGMFLVGAILWRSRRKQF